MSDGEMTGFWIAAAVLAGFIATLVALAIAVRPARYRLADTGCEMLDEDHWNDLERAAIHNLMETCFSFGVGLWLPLASVSILLDVVLRRQYECPEDFKRLENDRRFQSMFNDYFLSIAAANPLTVLASVPFMLVAGLIETAMTTMPIRLAFNEPMRVAAGRMATS